MKSSPRRREDQAAVPPRRKNGQNALPDAAPRPAGTRQGLRPSASPREHSGGLSGHAYPRRWRDRTAEMPFDRPPPTARGVGELLPDVLAGMGGDPVRLRLVQLWRHWEMVLGPDLAPLARPLGHRKDILLIGAEDAMLMQELHLQSGEILERVNAFMEGPFFASVKVSLCFQQTELDNIAPPPPPPLPAVERPRLTGSALDGMRADSAVARCYARFVALSRASRSTT